MPEQPGDIHLTIDVLKATGLTRKSKGRSKPNSSVTIKWVLNSESQKHETKIVKSSSSPEWNESIKLFFQSADSTISFKIVDYRDLDKFRWFGHSYGVVKKTVNDLLAAHELDILFPSHDAVLSITVKREGTNTAASDNLAAAQEAIRGLTEAPDTPGINGSPYAALGDVVTSLAKLMDIADTLAEIHPYVKFAWSVVSAVYKVVEDQLDRDDAIRGLLEAMAMLYSQSVLLKVKEKDLNETVVHVIRQVLQQTIECSLFIQDYSGKGFAGRAIKDSLSTTNNTRITDFKEAFTKLRSDLDMGLTVQTALISIRLVRGVEITTLKSELEPAAIEWTDRPVCHPHTRTDLQSDITKWILDPNGTNVLWLIGQVGAGKSTLATTIASVYAKTQRLGAFVFFDRNVAERSNPTNFVRTLAYELSKYDQRLSEKIFGAFKGHIAQGSLCDQFQYLIHQPLQDTASEGKPLASEGPIVVVIDGLDECGNRSSRKQLLNVLATQTKNLPQVVRIILTSRPEPDIRAQFDNQRHIKPLDVLPSDADVRVYMESELKVISKKKKTLGNDWPDDVKLANLVSLAGGLFIWASTACKYIDAYNPKAKLDDLLQDGVHKGKELDDIYNKALNAAGNWSDDDLRQTFQDVIGAISVAKNPMTTETIDGFLELEKGSSKELLSLFASVIYQVDNEPVHIFHKSFSDFITNPNRCTNSTWLITLSHHEHHAALRCIAQMKEVFKTPHHFTQSIMPEVNYDDAVKYSCSYWIHHVITAVEGPERAKMAKIVYSFMEVHTMHWLEAISVLKGLHFTLGILDKLYKWAMHEGTEDLKTLTYDAYRFIVFFLEIISLHPAMTMQDVLPFAPTESKLYQLFHDHHKLPTIIGGYQQKWPPLLHTFHIFGYVESVSFSPDMTKIVCTCTEIKLGRPTYQAICWETAIGIEAYSHIELDGYGFAQFSSDGTQVWVATALGSVYVLDTKTDDWVSELRWNIWHKKHFPQMSRLPPSSGWRSSSSPYASSFVGSLLGRRAPNQPPSSIHYSVSPLHGLESHHLGSSEGQVSISPMCGNTGSDAAQGSSRGVSLPVDPSMFEVEEDLIRSTFSGDGRWVIFANDSGKLYVIDRKDGKPAYGLDDYSIFPRQDKVGAQTFPSIEFSPDSKVFAAGLSDGHIYVWQTESGKKLHQLEGHTKGVHYLSFSSGGDKLYSVSGDGIMKIWDHAGVCVSSVIIAGFGGHSFYSTAAMALSPDGRLAWASGSTIHICDASTGKEVGPLLEADNDVSLMSFSQDGSRLVSVVHRSNLQTWDVSWKSGIIEHSQHTGFPDEVAFSPSGLIVHLKSRERYLSTRFWSAATGHELEMVPEDMSANFITQVGNSSGHRDNKGIKRKMVLQSKIQRHIRHGHDIIGECDHSRGFATQCETIRTRKGNGRLQSRRQMQRAHLRLVSTHIAMGELSTTLGQTQKMIQWPSTQQ